MITQTQQSEFNCVNLLAHTMLREQSKPKIAPCWLCTSDEAKDEGRQLAAKWFNDNANPIFPVNTSELGLVSFERQLEPMMKPMMKQWIDMETHFEKLRTEENNPKAFFCPN